MLDKKYTANVDEQGLLQLPDDFIKEVGWKPGDRIRWIDRGNGSFELKKVDTQLVFVECVSQFRTRYVVEVPVGVDQHGNDKSLWALDTVTMEEAKQFSQKHLGESIVSHRVISHEEMLKLCDEDNDYCSNWAEEVKFVTFVTQWNEEK
jgi:bifunctional DNA-binding transcriptional regulator/antitoxin component of YhaV-PrlF toxin-antitoxin module